ncbi:MAG TPA: contact-dependent growth inhibition system immunity protein [Thermoguttaceae bacterium]|nr:contact-dependent growth inhibition system immunity protein [Thermoguttaceae bacterium]
MHVQRLNRPIFELPDSHPAHRFLRAFIKCRQDCVGREIQNDDLDQEWVSDTDGRSWSYSAFAYEYLAFDIVLDGWLSRAQDLTPTERYWLEQLPRWRALQQECKSAALRDGKLMLIPLVDQVLAMLDLWEQCIRARQARVHWNSRAEAVPSSITNADYVGPMRVLSREFPAFSNLLGSWFADAKLEGYGDDEMVRMFLTASTEDAVKRARKECAQLLERESLPVQEISDEANRCFASQHECREWVRGISLALSQMSS